VVLLEPRRTPYDLNWRLGDIPIRVHPMFWLFSAILGWSAVDLGFEYLVLWVACVFVSVLVHELGHVLMGRYFGYDGHIVLYSFGGLAIGSNAMANRWQRIAVSFAGPLAGFLFLAVLVGAVYVVNPPQVSEAVARLKSQVGIGGAADLENMVQGLRDQAEQQQVPDQERMRAFLQEVARRMGPPTLLESAFLDLCLINLLWGLMNLLPIWPLDGGQISRDFLGWLVPGNGLRLSLGISFLVASLLAINALLVHHHKPHLPYLAWLGGVYAAILFGLLALESFQLLQKVEANRAYGADDEGTRWERDPEIWRR
jgi:membrane-associated protease RseP (regulator of RpoE activity)